MHAHCAHDLKGHTSKAVFARLLCALKGRSVLQCLSSSLPELFPLVTEHKSSFSSRCWPCLPFFPWPLCSFGVCLVLTLTAAFTAAWTRNHSARRAALFTPGRGGPAKGAREAQEEKRGRRLGSGSAPNSNFGGGERTRNVLATDASCLGGTKVAR